MVDPLHPDEVAVDLALVRRLVRNQHPELAGLELRASTTQGTDNVVYRLGGRLSVRLPRKEGAVESLLVERTWLPRVAPGLPLAVPHLVAAGEAAEGYPFPWLITTWVDGSALPPAGLGADDIPVLAGFVRALESLDPTGGPRVPPGRRAGPVVAYDERFRAALAEVVALQEAGRIERDLFDATTVRSVWDAALDAPPWRYRGVWLHRDLIPSNLLVSSGRLSGILDFGGLAVGDPAGDVMAAFHLFSAADRPAFRAAVAADEATWVRARAWALVQGIEALHYYLDTHPGMVAMGRRVIRAVLEDADG